MRSEEEARMAKRFLQAVKRSEAAQRDDCTPRVVNGMISILRWVLKETRREAIWRFLITDTALNQEELESIGFL